MPVSLLVKQQIGEAREFLPEQIESTRRKHSSWVRWLLTYKYKTPLERLEDFEQEVWLRASCYSQKQMEVSIRTHLKYICRGVVRDYIVHVNAANRAKLYQFPLHPNGKLKTEDDFMSSPPSQEVSVIISDIVDRLPKRYRETMNIYLSMSDYWHEWFRTSKQTMPLVGNKYDNAARIREANRR